MVNTQLLTKFSEGSGDIYTPEMTSQALKRVAEPVEIVGMIAHLLGDESKFTTGSIINIDGGWSC
jgi:NAD(P)-dependent dehydrogenase (short-subunit alcohol dehydrogenase family)